MRKVHVAPSLVAIHGPFEAVLPAVTSNLLKAKLLVLLGQCSCNLLLYHRLESKAILQACAELCRGAPEWVSTATEKTLWNESALVFAQTRFK